MFNVNVISRETIKPSCPTPQHLRYHQASLFDHANIPILMPLIFFFTPKRHTTITINTVLDRIKRSLRDTLSVFYPLAGRFIDTNHIACSDEGVPYVEAKVIGDLCLKDVVHKAEVAQLDLLVPSDGQEGYTSLLLAIQVTIFPCGGVSVGVKMSHAISDAFSMFMFVNTWTNIAKYGKDHLMLLPQPYFEISKVFPPSKSQLPNGMDAPHAAQNPDLLQDRPVAKRFMFSHAKLDALRSKMYVMRHLTRDNNSLPSLPMVLSAFIWSRMNVGREGGSEHIPYEVYHAVNIRPKVRAPEQCYYFGNMVVNALAKPSISLGDNNNANKEECYYLCRDFMKRVKESINRILIDSGFVRELQEGREDLTFMLEHYERESRGEIASLGFSNLRSLPVYEADFGWGEPVWVTTATLLGKGLVIFIPSSPSSKDIDAYINLSDEDMAKLESDNEFISLVSKAPSATASSKL